LRIRAADLSSTTSTHHADRAQTSLTSCRLPAAADWKPRAHLELMISMAATVIFWTADLRVTASTRIGAPPRSSWQIPPPSCWRPRTRGRGAYAIDQKKRQRSLLGSSAADGADESSGAIMGVGQAGSTFNPRGCLRTP